MADWREERKQEWEAAFSKFGLKQGDFVSLNKEGRKELLEAKQMGAALPGGIPVDILAHGMWVVEDYDDDIGRAFISAFRLTEDDQILGEGGFWVNAENVNTLRESATLPGRLKTVAKYRPGPVRVRSHRRHRGRKQ
jgi:hypothetical protein